MPDKYEREHDSAEKTLLDVRETIGKLKALIGELSNYTDKLDTEMRKGAAE